MNIRIMVIAAFALPSGAVFAGGANPPGPGVQVTGSTTTTSGISNMNASSAIANAITASGGARGIADAIQSMPGAATAGEVVTSPPITIAGMTVTIIVNTVTGIVTVSDAGGNVIYSGQ